MLINKRHFLLTIILISAIAVFSGCGTSSQNSNAYFMKTKSEATVFVNPQISGFERVAILPFRAPTELIGRSVSELFVTELLMSRKYTLVERSQIDKILGESELAMSGMTQSNAAKIGAMVGADGVIIGTVDQYETIAIKGKSYPVIGITLRLIDCETSGIGWSVDLAKQSSDGRASLSTHSREVVHEMMAGLYQELVKYAPPTKPKRVSVSDMGLREAKISWSQPSDRSAIYQIERARKAEGPFETVAKVKAGRGSYTDSDLKDAETYYYRILPIGDNGVSGRPTEPEETFTAPPPVPPATVEATSDLVGSIKVNWAAPVEKMYLQGFKLESAPAKDGPFTVLESVSDIKSRSYMDGGREPGKLPSGESRFYRVISVNEAGVKSSPSPIAEGLTRPLPPKVKSFTGESNCPREVPLAWSPSTDEKVEGYYIYRKEPGEQYEKIETVKGRNSSKWIDRGGARSSSKLGDLADGTSYEYKIVAYNIGDVTSPDSDVVSVTTKPVPGEPDGLVAADNCVRKVALEWKANKEKDIAHYRVEIASSADGKFKAVTEADTPAAVCEDLKDGTEYFFRLVAVDQDTLESRPSPVVSATTKPCPDPPTSLASREAESGSCVLLWKAPPQDDVTSYTIFKKSFLKKEILGYSNETEFLLDSDQIGKEVSVFVIAKNADGQESEASEVLEIKAPVAQP